MAEMSMNKAIHGAVRRDLRRFVDALAAFPPGDTGRAKQLHTAWTNFADQLHHHHTDEHAIAWPALVAVGVPRDVISTMDEEHDAMAAALDEAGTAMERLSRAPNGRIDVFVRDVATGRTTRASVSDSEAPRWPRSSSCRRSPSRTSTTRRPRSSRCCWPSTTPPR